MSGNIENIQATANNDAAIAVTVIRALIKPFLSNLLILANVAINTKGIAMIIKDSAALPTHLSWGDL